MREPRRIVVTRLRFLGDVVLSTPLLAQLRESYPEASVEYVVEEPFGSILERHPDVDAVHVLPRGASLAQTVRLVRRLRSPRVDWWIDLLTNPRSCVLAALVRPRIGVGSDRGIRARVYRHRRLRPPGNPSAIAHHLDKLVPLMGPREESCPRLHIGDDELAACRASLGLSGNESPVLLHPGSTWPDKAWPEERWVELAEKLRPSAPGPLWMIQPPGQEQMVSALAQAASVRLLPVLELRALMALLCCSRMLIANDGGVTHCAVGLGIPTVTLFGPTDPSIWFPYEGWGPYRVIHDDRPHPSGNPDGSRLTGISVDTVVDTVLELWSRPAAAEHA